MDIEASSAIKLFFPNPSLALVYFEALANALDAGATEISISIEIASFNNPETLKIIVIDNGAGFIDENFERFRVLLRPRDTYHKGIGRLVFLNYFDQVEVASTWGDNQRVFVFKEQFDGHSSTKKLRATTSNRTKLTFAGFSKERVKSYDDLKPDSLKVRIIEHFLPTLNDKRNQGVDFRIDISLSTDETNAQKEFFSNEISITPIDLPSLSMLKIQDDHFDALTGIDMYYHVKQSESAGKAVLLTAISVDGRTIPINLIQPTSVPPGYSIVFLFVSDIFYATADSSRQKLVLPESIPESLLYATLRREIGKVLANLIPQINEKNTTTKTKFEERFPHLLGYFEESTVGLIDSDEALNVAQQKFFKVQKEVLQCDELSDSIYEKSLEISSRTLTEYILYRDKIIRRMKAMTHDNSEDEIHNLIVPRHNVFSGDSMIGDVYQNNAWLLDDRFMTFRTILSEARMDRVINEIRLDEECGEELGRPDIAMIFSGNPDEGASVDVVVVEIKRKTDDEKENHYAINQLLDRAVKLVAYCPNVQRIWYYAVISIGDTMSTRLRQMKWTPLFSKGKVFYQEFSTERADGSIVPTPMFVMSFDAIVADAECRNHTFLEILREGMKKHAERLLRPEGLAAKSAS